MKKLIFILLSLSLAACNPVTVTPPVLENIVKLSAQNEGLSKVLFLTEEKYVMLFNNGTSYGQLDVALDKSLLELLPSEMVECEVVCTPNGGLNQITLKNRCAEKKEISIHQICLAYENNRTCNCNNSVSRKFTKTLSLTEAERIKLIEDTKKIIWVAPM